MSVPVNPNDLEPVNDAVCWRQFRFPEHAGHDICSCQQICLVNEQPVHRNAETVDDNEVPLDVDINDCIAWFEHARARACAIADRVGKEAPPPNPGWLSGAAAMLAKHGADTMRRVRVMTTDDGIPR